MTRLRLRLLVALLLFPPSALWGLILYSGDNTANQTDPATGVPFGAVASVCNAGGASPSGSAVHLTGKYMLTANHVANRATVTFDGVTYWARDTGFTPVKIGTADLKVFKLIEDPGVDDVTLADSSTKDTPSNPIQNVTATLVAYGRGRSASDTDGDNTWVWGDNTTLTKRWGSNNITGTQSFEANTDYNYTYTALVTRLDSNAGDNEAGLVTYDSGSGMFINDGGTWKLAGIATLVSTAGSSTFGGLSPDSNYFVRIKEVADAIEAAIPDTSTLDGWLTDYGLYNNDALHDADPDLDGLTNLEEFAFGSDPTAPSPEATPIVENDGGTPVLRYQINAAATGVSITPEWSADLVSASWSNSDFSQTLDSTEGDIQHWSASYTGAFDTVFLHLNVQEL